MIPYQQVHDLNHDPPRRKFRIAETTQLSRLYDAYASLAPDRGSRIV